MEARMNSIRPKRRKRGAFKRSRRAFFVAAAIAAVFLSAPFARAGDGLKPGDRIRGLNYGPFRKGQDPATASYPSADQLKEDMAILARMSDVIRIYSVSGGLDRIVGLAEKHGISVVAGAWLGSDDAVNQKQVDALVEVVRSSRNIPFLVVGNEAILRSERGWPDGLPKHKVIKKIVEVRRQVNIPVTTAEAWKVWEENPYLAKAVDLIFMNIHPYWENKDVSEAARHILEKYRSIQKLYPDKRVILGEVGWPTAGQPNGLARPGVEEQERFLKEFLPLAEKEGIDFFVFEAFDEDYKKAEPNGVGPHWGVLNSEGMPKHSIVGLKGGSPGNVMPSRTKTALPEAAAAAVP